MLLIISAKVAHSLWRYFSFSAEYTVVSPSANKPPRADAKTFDKNDVQLISQQNWFGKYQPVATPVKQPEPVPVAETRLNVVLRGIAFGARPGAVIEEGGKQQVYLQGERLGSHNAVIEEINRDHVMLRYQGKIERLSLAEEGHSTVAVTNKKAVSDEAKQAVAEPAASAPVEIPTAVRQALTKDPQKIFNYIQLTPVRKEGIVGYAVKPGADRSLFDASGFKEGDIAIALNQQDFTDPRAMIALMRQLPSMDSIQLTVLRKGARHDISIALRYYVLIWQPLSERIEQQETMLQQLVAMNTRLRSAAPDIIAARKSATTTPAQVSRVISDSASAHSVVIKRIAERGENIQVWIDPVVFNDLLNWLNALDEKYALRVTQIDASAAEKPGMVNVQRLEFGRG